jgi:phosphoribosylformylglycinamidine (FGAM) synthase-like amidotransferase family enzyme
MKLHFAQMLGRDNFTNDGRRRNLDYSQDSVKLSDIKNLKDAEIIAYPKKFSYKDFLPNSLIKRQKMREMVKKSSISF